MSASNIIENPLLRCYAFYSSILIVKMIFMSLLTAFNKHFKIFANPEDVKSFAKKGDKNLTVKTDPDVERVRRAHLNDLENIPAFLFISALYLLTGPSIFLATTLMRVFTAARIIHTIVYAVVVIPQPARGLAWGIGFAVTLYMAVVSVMHYVV